MFSVISKCLGFNECSICSEIIFIKSKTVETQCGHYCHKDCAEEYFKINPRCNKCKERVCHSYYFFKITNPMIDELLKVFNEIQKLDIKIIEINENEIQNIFDNLLKVIKYYEIIQKKNYFITKTVARTTADEVILTYNHIYEIYYRNYVYYSKYKYCVHEDKKNEYKKIETFMINILKIGKQIKSLILKSKKY